MGGGTAPPEPCRFGFDARTTNKPKHKPYICDLIYSHTVTIRSPVPLYPLQGYIKTNLPSVCLKKKHVNSIMVHFKV